MSEEMFISHAEFVDIPWTPISGKINCLLYLPISAFERHVLNAGLSWDMQMSGSGIFYNIIKQSVNSVVCSVVFE
jgi:hypothetical protein